MWARLMELSLGLWLAISPFVLRHPPEHSELWVNDFVCGALVATGALLAHWRPLGRIHLALLLVAAWLVAWGWWATWSGPDLPAYQNWMVVGLLLFLLDIVPNEASLPPESWRRRPRVRNEGGIPDA